MQALGFSVALFPYNFTIALPIQMLAVAPLCGKFVNAVGDKLGWNGSSVAHQLQAEEK